jgi:quinol monooxygenase YgiN
MAVGVLLEWRFKPDVVDQAPSVVAKVLATTRTFDGCIRIDVLVDDDDPTRWLLVELWESLTHDAAYREFRAGPGKVTEIPPMLAAPPVLTRYTVADV